MTMQGNQAGIAQAMEYAFVAGAGGQSRFVGADSKGFVLNYVSGFLWVIVDGYWWGPDDFTATDGSSVTLNATVDAGTSVRLIAIPPFNLANTYTQAQSDTLYAKRRNRIIDPGMRVSQENGNNSLTLANSASLYPSDSFYSFRVGSTGGASVQRIALTTPGGSPYRIRVTVTAANSAPAAGDALQILTAIEGVDVADLKFGTTSPRSIAIRLGVRSSIAGTFPVALRNGAGNRSYLGFVTISAAEVGNDVVKTVFLTGDTTGTWPTDNSSAFVLSVNLCCGTTYQGVTGWQSGNYISLASGTNLMATANATFDLFDVGLYDVTGLQSGVIPPFELDSIERDTAKCQRYYFYSSGFNSTFGYCNSGAPIYTMMKLPVSMRVVPTLAAQAVSYGNATGLGLVNASNDQFQTSLTITSTGPGYANYTYTANARL